MIYIVTTISGKELDAVYALKKAGYTAYAPRAVRRYRRGKEIRYTAEIMFDGYVFIDLPKQLAAEEYFTIRNINGIGGFLSRSSSLPDYEEEYIKGLSEAETEISKAVLKKGRLRVISGWLKKHENRIIKFSARQHKAVVKLELYGKPCTITCTVDIQKI